MLLWLQRTHSIAMPPAGIEPALQAPEACVLSVERQGRDPTITKKDAFGERLWELF
jgi:hypothetical protein